jgi:hypothetical protein
MVVIFNSIQTMKFCIFIFIFINCCRVIAQDGIQELIDDGSLFRSKNIMLTSRFKNLSESCTIEAYADNDTLVVINLTLAYFSANSRWDSLFFESSDTIIFHLTSGNLVFSNLISRANRQYEGGSSRIGIETIDVPSVSSINTSFIISKDGLEEILKSDSLELSIFITDERIQNLARIRKLKAAIKELNIWQQN